MATHYQQTAYCPRCDETCRVVENKPWLPDACYDCGCSVTAARL
ncbi:hypothetical protein [Haloprofundus halobius]|nr:hypothetical protein [Haloprofundus halobius]